MQAMMSIHVVMGTNAALMSEINYLLGDALGAGAVYGQHGLQVVPWEF